MNITPQTLSEGYDGLQERSKFDVNFVLLTVSAGVICALGFKMNSDSVIVGAMVVAPLLHPLICAGATSYKRKWNAVAHALATFAMGFVVATLAAIVINLLYRTTFQSEITARLSGWAGAIFLSRYFRFQSERTRSFRRKFTRRSPASQFLWH